LSPVLAFWEDVEVGGKGERARRSKGGKKYQKPTCKENNKEKIFRKKEYTLCPKIFAPFDFYRARLTIRLI
jgi:hypothetical protein